MSSIRKRGETYQAQVRLSGGRASSATFKTKAEAQVWVREQAFALAQLPKNRDERTTLGDVIERFISDVIPIRQSGDIEALRLGVVCRHPIASRRLAEINSSDLCSYRDQRLRQVKRNTLVREFGLLRSVVSTAIDEWGITVDNPLKSFHIKREPDQRLRRLSRDELKQLISTECNNPYTKPMILFALETAMRLGELLSLKWSRVDLDRGFAELQKTKNGHGRMVPLTAAALSVLSNLERDSDVVFPVKPGTLKQSWVRLVKRAGISDLRFHDLRHEAISRLLEKELTIPEAASVSGHKTASMLLRYAHPDPVKVREKMMS